MRAVRVSFCYFRVGFDSERSTGVNARIAGLR